MLAPGLASAHGGHDHGNATSPSPPPGPASPWTPPANASGNRSAPAATSPTPPPQVSGPTPTVGTPGTLEWLGFKGDAFRTGASQARPAAAPVKRWDAVGTGGVGIYASPVVAEGLVVFAGLDRLVHAVDVAGGFARWTFAMPSMVYASPAIAGDLVLVVSSNGTLVALDLESKEERWRVSLDGPTSGSPLVVNGVVFTVTETGRVAAFDASDGTRRWNRTLPPVESVVSPLWVAGRVILGHANGQVTALHALTGQTLWTSHVGHAVTATPVAAGNRIVVPTLGLKGLEVETGHVYWTRTFGSFVRSSPAYQAGILVYGDPDAPGLASANAQTGQPVWPRVPTRLFVRSAPAIAQDVVVAAADDGTLMALRLRNGSLLWTLDAGERMRASPVLLDGQVLAARMDGVLRLFADADVSAGAADAPEQPVNGYAPLLDLLPILVVLGLPYVGLTLARNRLRARTEAAASAGLSGPGVQSSAPAARAPQGGFLRVHCPRCSCRFGVQPRTQTVVVCPGCSLRSELRKRSRAFQRPGDA